ncbi:hypothetical protein [Marinobacter sp. SS21]|uniref:hypothetical protein n=1 Tax=Marinobacter sp. SS21 TaxID=2979460 RepID=UPI00232C6AD1|nr:hypothetical protein [Marinobacter sp. SS21]MDC0663816.1 hypothetical protein [Marinobacter sp. SS21]
MLKRLWRKTLDHPALSTRNEARERQVRLLPHLTHTGEFHLDRLTRLLTDRYSLSLESSGDDAIRQLIQYAARVQDKDVQRELLLFYLNCSPVIQDYLRSGDIFGNDHFLSRRHPPSADPNGLD